MFAPSPPPTTLPAAVAVVCRDPTWWQKCLLHGALATTIIGLPLAVGFIMESYDNSRRGFPIPLPPWRDWTLRALTGIFALLIDLAFFLLPLMIGGLLLACSGLALVLAGQTDLLEIVMRGILTLMALVWLSFFLIGVAPIGRLIFAEEGQIERALSSETLRRAFTPPYRTYFWHARLASLAAYIPAAAMAGLTGILIANNAPLLVIVIAIWLLCSVGIFAQLVGVQLYVAAEQQARATQHL
ncbi:MAG: hypothetical protein KatS3mg055_0850 [Chloroflexus sp.]|uniref:DUF4013 domain-containing protein n=1 Tax=Chloroflexus sp. TaxID=1904827 RepID=UPI0021DD37A0|nr:DUF4013 domain-containing protein [Chloroflexus sp.]GIV88332.1 MAG: hypothetical protein KatS3mg055_0850 [Chloroflexus sp.]